ncbi:hypothetical protein HMPREF9946_00755 [Acetobacteraceae bacterium AT-5844]|nr:hypothetical protein HMPREF9946_00755 [Acetobacteraceae bacterium AT-5844]
MQRTITRLYDTRENALAAIRDLEAAGFSHDDLGIVATDAQDTTTTTTEPKQERSSTGLGATLGTLVGGGAGLAAALGALAIPGIGPLVAAGALATTLVGAGAGAVAGGVVGSLVHHGVSEEHAHVYAEGMRRGGSLVTARVPENRAGEVEAILARHNPVDPALRETEYRAGGWRGYEEEPVPMSDNPRTRNPRDPLMPGGPFNDRQI